MCIAIVKPEGKILTREVLEQCYNANRDGAGFAYYDPSIDEVCIRKGYFSFDKFYSEFSEFQHLKCLVHFRIATHRVVNGENCHPWRINDDLVFIHNGTISGMNKNDDWSDTGNFCNNILKEMLQDYPEFYKTSEFKWLIENSVSTFNKLAFLDSKGNHIIVNEKDGYWDQGCWFSNKSYTCYRHGFKILESSAEDTEDSTVADLDGNETNTQVTTSAETPEVINTESEASNIDVEDVAAQLTSYGMAEVYATESELDAALEALNNRRHVATT